MEKYINSIITISVVGGIITTLLPEKSSNLKKYVTYLIGLICALTILSPITSIINNVSNIKNNINDFFNDTFSQEAIDSSNNIIIDTSIDKVSDGIKTTLVNKFKIDSKELDVNIEINNEDISSIKITSITIILRGNATWENENSIKEFLEGIVSCEIKIKKI